MDNNKKETRTIEWLNNNEAKMIFVKKIKHKDKHKQEREINEVTETHISAEQLAEEIIPGQELTLELAEKRLADHQHKKERLDKKPAMTGEMVRIKNALEKIGLHNKHADLDSKIKYEQSVISEAKERLEELRKALEARPSA